MNAKILVVDDSFTARNGLRQMLQNAGYTVTEADDGMTALEQYSLEKPDLVLLDLVMQGMYGLDVLTKLRELDPSARVLVATADIQASTREMAQTAGACGMISKPFTSRQVLEAVHAALQEGTQPNVAQ
ncbi:MAG: response regulator [Acidobacteria bacterium]|nr:response regulator [Acidobacteriota bacterium]